MTTDLPSMTSRTGLNLIFTLATRSAWVGLNEGAADVVIADQAMFQLDPGLLGEAQGHGVGAVRYAEHHLRPRGRMLPRQFPAQFAADPVHRLAEDGAVGPGEVHQLEDAAAHRPGLQRPQLGDLAVLDPHELARGQLADQAGTDQVQGAGLGGDDDARAQAPHHQRPEAAAVHHRVERPPDREHQGVGALGLLQRLADLLLRGRRLGPGDQMDQHLGIGGTGEDGAAGDQIPFQFRRVGEIAVVGHRERALVVVHQAGLGVGQDRTPRGGVAGVAHGHVAGQAAQQRFVEVFRDQAHAPVGVGLPLAVDR